MEKEVHRSTHDVHIKQPDIDIEEEGAFTTYLTDNTELVSKSNELHKKLDQKNRDIERLCCLLEALEPAPGMDIGKYKSLIESKVENDINVDARDAKIVSLAKKSRNLTVALNKEKGLNESKNTLILELENKCDKLQREMKLIQNQKTTSKEFDSNGNNDNIDLLKKELNNSNKKVEEFRIKQNQLQEDIKKLTFALTKEVGDGTDIEDVKNGEGWKGRAQQILLLKSKIKRLESNLSMGKSNASSIGSIRNKVNDVDFKAEEELEYMSSERKHAVDTLFEERLQLQSEVQNLETKNAGYRARIKNLETDVSKTRTSVKMMLEKSGNDDELIAVLRDEVDRLRQQLNKSAANVRQIEAANTTRVVNMKGTAVVSNASEVELQRLQRLCKQQASQLATQDEVIRELRGKNSSEY